MLIPPVRVWSKRKIWFEGLICTTVLIVPMITLGATSGMFLATLIVSLGFTAFFAEASALLVSGRSRNLPTIPPGARPADGLVEILAISGVESLASQDQSEFRRFFSMDGPDPPVRQVEGLRPLLGQVALVSVFVGRDGKSWSELEIAEAHKALRRAALWIEREATRHHVPLNVGLAEAYFVVHDANADDVEVAFQAEANDFGPLETHASTKALIMASRGAASLGFRDVADWMDRINARIGADATVWLFHLRQAGRSFAIPANDSEIPGVGLAVCYSTETNFPEPLQGRARVDPTTVAHEFLHLFDASDKYGDPRGSFPPGSVSSHEIMRLNYDSLSLMTIDPLTALEIGWSSQIEVKGSNKNARRRPF
jgi:hypothetical protein